VLFAAQRFRFKAAAGAAGLRRSARRAPVSAPLPAMPDELWLEILGWLRRAELGRSGA
jgi:hypothetical protein